MTNNSRPRVFASTKTLEEESCEWKRVYDKKIVPQKNSLKSNASEEFYERLMRSLRSVVSFVSS